MIVDSCHTVSVSSTIDAAASTLFEILAQPQNHPMVDGSGMLRAATSQMVLSQVGDVFTMAMYNDEMGDYEMANHVVEYEPDRRIVWEPVLLAASRSQDADAIGEPASHRWGFELSPTGPATTRVTEIYDCSRSPAWLRKAVKDGERWRESMSRTLEKLQALAVDRRRVPAGA